MSSFLCFICHSTVNKETTEEIRDKYREVVGINLCPDSQLCFICCHVLNKLSLFRSICLKRSLEYPVLFREKGTLNLQKSDLEIHVLCPEDCNQYQRSEFYQFSYNNDFNDTNYNNDNEYVKLEHENVFHDYFSQCQYQNVENNEEKVENNYDYTRKIDEVNDIYLTENNDLNTDLTNDVNDTDMEETIENGSLVNENDHLNTDLDRTNKNESGETEQNLFNVGNDNDNEANDNDKNIEFEDVNESNNDEKSDNLNISKKKKSKKTKKKGFKKTVLSLEEQKAELEANRKEKKYMEAEFKCYNCALGFLFKDTYQAHMMRHEESNGEHQCGTCTLRFATPALLRAHTAAHAQRHTCGQCGAVLRPRAARAHRCGGWGEGEGEAVRAACHVCGSMFRDANGLQQHIRRVHTSKASGRLHSCGVCGDSFNTHAALRKHMIKHVKRTFPCSHCGAQYSSPYTRAQHERKHTVTSQQHVCTCGATYSTRKSLVAHQRNHVNHQQTLFECPICNRICPNQRSLASHVQTVHSASAEHACPACPARYTSRKSLLRHMDKHNKRVEVKMAVCYLCGNSFKGNNKLNRHLREVCEKQKLEEQISELY